MRWTSNAQLDELAFPRPLLQPALGDGEVLEGGGFGAARIRAWERKEGGGL